MAAIRIKWAVYQFEAKLTPHRTIIVSRDDKLATHAAVYPPSDEEQARQWLGDMGLDARQARRLLDAALRGAGPFADPKHPRRVAVR